MQTTTTRRLRYMAVAAGVGLGIATTGAAQEDPAKPTRAKKVTVVPGPEYEASGLKEKLLGEGWRDLWVAPVAVPVFDISTHAGGLKVARKGGGNQTRTLHFTDRSGRDYLFRSVNKFPVGQAMPPAIHGTTLATIIQDQVSGLFPAAGLAIPPFLQAIGVLHVTPGLYQMPDDPALGEYREEFAGLLGTVELSPQENDNDEPGFAGSRKIKSADKFLEDVEESRIHRLDERELFAIRLVDFLANDNDRTTDNMRFARFGDSSAYRWRPLPRDRDRAFGNATGWIIGFIVRPIYPKLIAFGPDYSLSGLTFESYQIDRRLLQRLTKADATEVALKVQSAITEDVIEKAIATLPPEWRSQQEVVAKLRTNLRARREKLPEVAAEFYASLASEVDLHGTDEDESVLIDRHADGRVTVKVRGKDDSDSAPDFINRTFVPDETNEVRIYMHGGDDRAIVRGAPVGKVTVRVIGGGGDDILTDSAGGGHTRFYDEKGKNKFVTPHGTRVSEKEWKKPREGQGIRLDAPWRPDWGKSSGWGPAFDYVSGGGLVVGFGPRYKSNGFRRLPHKWEAGANAMLALGNRLPGITANADYRFENSPMSFAFNARATRYEVLKFSGFGNETPLLPTRLSHVNQDLVAIEPMLIRQIGWRSREDIGNAFGKEEKNTGGLRPTVGRIHAGPVFLYNRAHPSALAPFASVGTKTVSRAGVSAGLKLDRTSNESPSTKGFTLTTDASAFPPLFDLEESFATLHAVAAGYVPLGSGGPHLAVRAGGTAVAGDFPVQHAAYIGGGSNVRGYSSRRYTGDKSGFGSAEIRVPVGSVPLLVRWNTGVFALADAGRVWFDGASPGGWHSAYGGGIWFSSLGQTFSVAYARGEEHRFYLQRGVSF